MADRVDRRHVAGLFADGRPGGGNQAAENAQKWRRRTPIEQRSGIPVANTNTAVDFVGSIQGRAPSAGP